MNKDRGKQKKMKRETRTGITLIALVITIIILLILAGITINLTIGQRGILNRAKEAGKNYVKSAEEEDKMLADLVKDMDNWDKEETPDPTPEEYFDFDPETGGISIKNAVSYYLANKEIGLKTLVIPSTYQGQEVKKIGIYLPSNGGTYFFGFPSIKDVEKIIIPDTVTEIANNVPSGFFKCSALKEVKLSQKLKIISGYSFAYTAISEINLPEGLEYIGTYAFWNTPLKEIRIPSTVTTVGNRVFSGCTSLEKVYVPFKEGEMPSGWNSKWNEHCNAEIIYQDS